MRNKVYDIETAEYITEYEYSNPFDFHWVREKLYRTTGGDYFLRAEGGGMSPYTRAIDETHWQGDTRIIPLDEWLLTVWLADRLGVEGVPVDMREKAMGWDGRYGYTQVLEAYYQTGSMEEMDS